MIELKMVGGAGSVTGSKYLLRTTRATVLLDCGLFQGHRKDSNLLNRALPVNVAAIHAVVLSHAHLDHSGALPLLWKRGYRGPIYATPATRDLCVPMLEDSAGIQMSDAAHIAKLIARGVDLDPVEALYDLDDVVGTLACIVAIPYRRSHVIAPGVTLTFMDAGHILGSAIVVLDIDDDDKRTRLVFSGDLGQHETPILRDPELPTGVDILMMESTYGDRLHAPVADSIETMATTIERTSTRGGKVVIPAFALERAQEVIFSLKQMRQNGRLTGIPVYVDSPLTVKVTDVFRLHPECYGREFFTAMQHDTPFDFPGLTYVSDTEASKALTRDPAPCVIIAGSGMCEGGRVLHHLRSMIGDPRSTVLIVGFQAEHTLGRRLAENRKEVKIFGVVRDRLADVVSLDGLSAHADQRGLIDFARSVCAAGRVRNIILVHGEQQPREILAAKLRDFHSPVTVPEAGQTIAV
jgi:metallo-beta-lactamase family protein